MAQVMLVERREEAEEHEVVLDQSIFHPQGGGQPNDRGRIRGPNGEAVEVSGLRVDSASGVLYHRVAGTSPLPFGIGDEVRLELDAALRRLHARCHSAGHLLDTVLAGLGEEVKGPQSLVPGKGSHSPGSCYVEYHGVVPA
eukprot:CAMPEP_0119135380 /NCGR_PEP_ID=MMETSP1310-20130426/19167_1 /TAXON_ID=464262 /ORGANISM="Genus nov. species nov., Strain RCC2339" /LENGTH=140 /DNA_ID=CAMNT_0007126257 /DNA_START=29 /DNA_END=447 /DNA_ORIENTATION=-